jgi:hypothetical protein
MLSIETENATHFEVLLSMTLLTSEHRNQRFGSGKAGTPTTLTDGGDSIMKALVFLTLAFSAITIDPALSFAQGTSDQLTRAQVRADLIRVEQAGYRMGVGNDPYYPADIQAAEAKVAAEHGGVSALNSLGGKSELGTSPADHAQ